MTTTLRPGDTPSRPLSVPRASLRPPRIAVPGRTLLLVAGMPGAGKSTLLAGLPAGPDLAVLDSEHHRAALAWVLRAGLPYGLVRPLVHLTHRAAVVRAAVSGPRTVVVHLPATSRWIRRAVRVLARLTGRDPHLLWLDVHAVDALRGQRERGRTVRATPFRRHADRAREVAGRLRAGAFDEPWTSAVVLGRAQTRRGLRLDAGPK
jgi:predicted kinase